MITAESTRKGHIFNIQRFSIHDGPGIRTTVFMKGCPLRCVWCSNPESQDFHPTLLVRDINCTGCGACLKVCPEGAITLTGETGRTIDWSKCTHCLRCVPACLYNSLNACGTSMTVTEVLDEVQRDEDFYRNSSGGVTLSGGEPLWQSDFVSSLLQACKARGLHTALETTGFSSWRQFSAVLDHTDLVLFDIKHLDPEMHRAFTGVDNRRILNNLYKIAGSTRIWLRMPVLGGINDSDEYIREMAALAKKTGAERVSLLPYHEGGKSKSAQMGRPYTFSQGIVPGEDRLKRIKDLLDSQGVTATIGH
ncbi:MAG: glycyl-radical enzyme activating protein [Syntrophales bacterium]|jgi:pyruvate formate lyase activating enzyme|nr:glycyl-radical enzyme activating protein [Syntrophales bacterium]MCK9528066.1 glycyl-radical enzyme activating protein [Syntrophales bacterium]MDX9922338.1 glycyl-radical enzyme activating protein [Syntrophales bacterium]